MSTKPIQIQFPTREAFLPLVTQSLRAPLLLLPKPLPLGDLLQSSLGLPYRGSLQIPLLLAGPMAARKRHLICLFQVQTSQWVFVIPILKNIPLSRKEQVTNFLHLYLSSCFNGKIPSSMYPINGLLQSSTVDIAQLPSWSMARWQASFLALNLICFFIHSYPIEAHPL